MQDKIEHLKRVILVTPDYQFRVDFDEGHRQFPTLREAKAAIENVAAAEAKAKKTKLALHAYDGDGNDVTITGINTNTSDLNGVPGDCYPRVTWIGESLKKMAALRAQIETEAKRVSPFRIRRGRGYGRMSADVYERDVETLTKEHATKTAQALKP